MPSDRLNFEQRDIKKSLLVPINRINQHLKLISYKPLLIEDHFIIRMTERKLSHSIILEMFNKLENRLCELLYCIQNNFSVAIRYKMHVDYYLFLSYSNGNLRFKTCVKHKKNSVYDDACVIDLN